MCAPDSDLDGWPDSSLNCSGNNVRCKADNCIFIPNSGQEDADNDGIGVKFYMLFSLKREILTIFYQNQIINFYFQGFLRSRR